MATTETLRLADGRRLAWEEAGDPHGTPIVYCHGVPGSRLQRRVFFRDDELRRARVRMITPDRPGFGRSDYQPRRRISDWPRDVAALVERLDLQRLAVLGFSGGTPYALALAASRLPVAAVGLVNGDAPPRRVAGVPPGLPATAARRPRLTALALRGLRFAARIAPAFTIRRGLAMLSEPDREAVADATTQRRFLEMLKSTLRQGPRGPLLDLELANREWGLRLPHARIPVQIWHGEADPDSPLAIARFFEHVLPSTQVRTFPEEGHVSVLIHHREQIVAALHATLRRAESAASAP